MPLHINWTTTVISVLIVPTHIGNAIIFFLIYSMYRVSKKKSKVLKKIKRLPRQIILFSFSYIICNIYYVKKLSPLDDNR